MSAMHVEIRFQDLSRQCNWGARKRARCRGSPKRENGRKRPLEVRVKGAFALALTDGCEQTHSGDDRERTWVQLLDGNKALKLFEYPHKGSKTKLFPPLNLGGANDGWSSATSTAGGDGIAHPRLRVRSYA